MRLVESKKLHLTYVISDTREAGIELFGFEVKALRMKLGSLEGAKVIVRVAKRSLLDHIFQPIKQVILQKAMTLTGHVDSSLTKKSFLISIL